MVSNLSIDFTQNLRVGNCFYVTNQTIWQVEWHLGKRWKRGTSENKDDELVKGDGSFKKMAFLSSALFYEGLDMCLHVPFKIRMFHTSLPFLFCSATVLWIGLRVSVFDIHLGLSLWGRHAHHALTAWALNSDSCDNQHLLPSILFSQFSGSQLGREKQGGFSKPHRKVTRM